MPAPASAKIGGVTPQTPSPLGAATPSSLSPPPAPPSASEGATARPPAAAPTATQQPQLSSTSVDTAELSPAPPPPPGTPGGSVADETSSVSGKPKKSAFYSAVKSVTKAIRRASFGSSSSAPSSPVPDPATTSASNAVPFAQSPTAQGGPASEDTDESADTQYDTSPAPPPQAERALTAVPGNTAAAGVTTTPVANKTLTGRTSPPSTMRSSPASSRLGDSIHKTASPGSYQYGTATVAAYPIRGSGVSVASTVSEPLAEPPVSAFVQDIAVQIDHDDPSVLKITAPGLPESDLADLLVPKRASQPVLKLVLKGNAIVSPERFCLSQRFEKLTDLDLSGNHITGPIKGLPVTLRRLDVSHNRISNVSSLLLCVNLTELNLAHNDVKSFHGLPPKLERLDLSHNVINSIITLRMLGLSPNLKAVNLTGNPVTLEVKEWKIVLCTVLTQLVEVNGRPLPKPKRAVAPPLTGKRSPGKSRPAAAAREEQRVNDAVRTKMHQLKLDMIKESKDVVERGMTVKAKSLPPAEMGHLSRRLSVPTQALKMKVTTTPPPPPLFSSADLARRSSVSKQPPAGYATTVAPSAMNLRGGDNEVSAWLNKSKASLEKAAKCVGRALKLASQEHTESAELTLLSQMFGRLELESCRDPPLKVETAIERLGDGDVMRRRVATVREHLDVVTLLVQQVDSAVLLSSQGVFKLREALDSALGSGPGLVAHTAVLRAYDASLDTSLLVRRAPGSPQRSSAIPRPAASSHAAHGVNTSVRSLFDNVDEGAVPEPKVEDRGFAESKATEVRAPSMSPEAFMDRVRSRITMRALYGGAVAAPEEENTSAQPAVAKSPERRALDFAESAAVKSGNAVAPPPPPPLQVPERVPSKPSAVAESQPPAGSVQESITPKTAAKQRVLARMRSTSRNKLDEEANEAVKPALSVPDAAAHVLAPAPAAPHAAAREPAPPARQPVEPAHPAASAGFSSEDQAVLTYSAESVDAEEPLFEGLTEDVLVPGEPLTDHYAEIDPESAEGALVTQEYQPYGSEVHVDAQATHDYDYGYNESQEEQGLQNVTTHDDRQYGDGFAEDQYTYDQGYDAAQSYAHDAYGQDQYGYDTYGSAQEAEAQDLYAADPYAGEYGEAVQQDGEASWGAGDYSGYTHDPAQDQERVDPSHNAPSSYDYTPADVGVGYDTQPAQSPLVASEADFDLLVHAESPTKHTAVPSAPEPVYGREIDTASAAPAVVTDVPAPVSDSAANGADSISRPGSMSDLREGALTPLSAAGSDAESKLSAKERLLARMAKNKKA
jgi:hypothetical protein